MKKNKLQIPPEFISGDKIDKRTVGEVEIIPWPIDNSEYEENFRNFFKQIDDNFIINRTYFDIYGIFYIEIDSPVKRFLSRRKKIILRFNAHSLPEIVFMTYLHGRRTEEYSLFYGNFLSPSFLNFIRTALDIPEKMMHKNMEDRIAALIKDSESPIKVNVSDFEFARLKDGVMVPVSPEEVLNEQIKFMNSNSRQ